MTLYRLRNSEVEAWQVGSGEPEPEWVSAHRGLEWARPGQWLIAGADDDLLPDFRFRKRYEPATSGWQPIETAPKDGGRDKPFLAFRKGGYWSLCFWSDKWGDWADYWDGDPASDYPPIHWQPLPPPPQPVTRGDETA